MRTSIIIFLVACILLSCSSENNTAKSENVKTTKSEASEVEDTVKFDQDLAEKLEADDYGMHKYVMAFLKVGPNRSQDSATRASLQKAHMENISKLSNDGVLVMAGPFLDGGDLRGIYIFDVETIEEAEQLTNTDPAVKAGSLIMELHPWYGSAALKQMNDIHEKIARINI